jgi:hypothetical protein
MESPARRAAVRVLAAAGGDGPAPIQEEAALDPETGSARSTFSRRVLDLGFLAGLALAAACLVLSGVYMIRFQRVSTGAVEQVLAAEASAAGRAPALSPEQASYRYRTQRLALSIHSYVAQTLLLSCGVLVGLAFGFLGFSLFLLGVDGASDVALDAPAKLKLQMSRLAPGVVVILCSTVLVGVCVTREQTITMNEGGAALAAAVPGTPADDGPRSSASAPPATSSSGAAPEMPRGGKAGPARPAEGPL